MNLFSSCWESRSGLVVKMLRFAWHISACETTRDEVASSKTPLLNSVKKSMTFSIRRRVMLFLCFSVKEVLVSCHLTPLSGTLMYYCIHYLDALRHAYLYVLFDQNSPNALKSGGVNTKRRMDVSPF